MARKRRRKARRSAPVKASRKRTAKRTRAKVARVPIVQLGQGDSTRRYFGGSGMKKARRKARRSGRRGSGSSRGLGGFVNRESLAAVGGGAAAAFAGPMIARYLPASLGQSRGGQVAAAVIVGAVGFFALRKFNRTAALAFLGASVGGTLSALFAPAAGVSGYDEDGNEVAGYLPTIDENGQLSGVYGDNLDGYDDGTVAVIGQNAVA